MTLHQKYRWYHFSGVAGDVCVYYLLHGRCLDHLNKENHEAVFTLNKSSVFFFFDWKAFLSLVNIYCLTKHDTFPFTSHEI